MIERLAVSAIGLMAIGKAPGGGRW